MRVDARAKVTGAAQYGADLVAPEVLHGLFVTSTVSAGRVGAIDRAEATAVPGVVAIYGPGELGPLSELEHWAVGQSILPLSDDRIRHEGQPLALILGDTLVAVREAGRRLEIEEVAEPGLHDFAAGLDRSEEIKDWAESSTSIGDVEAGLGAAHRVVSAEYRTADRHHAAMEPAVVLAWFDRETLELITSTQWVFGVKGAVAEALGMDPSLVRVRTEFVGGGFGAKGSTWPHEILAALAARATGRAVRIVLPRSQTFTLHGHQPATIQRVTLGAAPDGALTAMRHLSWSAAARDEDYIEHGSLGTRGLYRCTNIETHDRAVRLHRPQPTFMRAPHEGPGMPALEIAMDELAVALSIDPLELRLRNYTDRDPTSGKPFSSKTLDQCYRLGAAAFGWDRRTAEPGSMRDGGGRARLGWGMATALMATFRFGASARATVRRDGQILVETAAHEIGTGTTTVLARIAGEVLAVEPDRIEVVLGDTTLPEAGGTFGSATTLSVGSAVQAAVIKLKGRLEKLAHEPGLQPDEYAELLTLHGLDRVAEEATWAPNRGENSSAMNAYGAVFAEVRVDPDLPIPRVSRVVGAYSVGRVIDPDGARSQIAGGITWGIGQALLEESAMDLTLGRFVGKGFGSYQIPVSADIPQLEILFPEEFDSEASAIGARGVGEIGTIGIGAAVANAVYHATGVRVRKLPIRVEELI
jgi:xanthine dehydrogenase YagR molybdenum-binding subunit